MPVRNYVEWICSNFSLVSFFKKKHVDTILGPNLEYSPLSVQKGRPRTITHLSPLTCDSGTQFVLSWKAGKGVAGCPVHKQAIYSSGTAWREISSSPDPVLLQKHLNPTHLKVNLNYHWFCRYLISNSAFFPKQVTTLFSYQFWINTIK